MIESESDVIADALTPDPSIEKLLPYTQAAHMQRVFQSHCIALFGERLRVQHCEVFYSRYKSFQKTTSWVKSSISVCYRNTLRTQSGGIKVVVVFAQSYLEGRSIAEWEKLSALRSCTRPTLHLPDLGMIVWRHPSDPSIASLPVVLSSVLVRDYIPLRQLPEMACVKQDRLTVVPEIIKYSPGKCCTTNFRIILEQVEHDQDVQIYGKTYNDARGRKIYQRWCHMKALSDQGGDSFKIARPLAYDDSINTVWQAAIDGTMLETVLDAHNFRRYIPKIAAGLALVHSTNFIVSRRVDITELCLDFVKKLNKLDRAVPSYRHVLMPLIEWGKLEQPTGRQSPQRLLHGDFHSGQFLVKDNDIYMFDLDSMTLGDPELDWAEFTVDLVMREWDADFVQAIIECALETYLHHVGWGICMKRLRWYAVVEFITRLHHHYRDLRSGWADSIGETISLLPVLTHIIDEIERRQPVLRG